MNAQELVAEVIEHLRGMWRYRWQAGGIAWVVSILGWAVILYMPDLYRASAQVFVDANGMLRPLMQGLSAQQDPLDEVQLVSRAVLTRPNLEVVARESGIGARAGTQTDLENLITDLQRRVRVTGGLDNIFTIQFEDPNRETALAVVAATLDTFVEGALGSQGDDAQLTERAVESEIKEHEDRLRTAEAELADFKRANLGYMPNEAGDYYARLQGAIAAHATVAEQARLLTERRDELTRQVEGEEPVFGIMGDGATASVNCPQATQIAELKAQLAGLSVQFTEKHPRLVSLRETVNALEARCAAEQLPAAAPSVTSLSPAPLAANLVYQNLRLQLSNADVELAGVNAELRTRREAVAQLRADVDKIVDVERQLAQLNRDYEVVQTRHQELIRRWEGLQAKLRLDPVTDTVQFRRIQPPFVPEQPVYPNRPLLVAALLAVALGAGAAVAFALNRIHPTFFSRGSLRKASGLPVLGSVSFIEDALAARARRAGMAAFASTFAALAAATVLLIAFGTPASEFVRSLAEKVGA